MCVESIDSEDVKCGPGIDFELDDEQEWNGRTVKKNLPPQMQSKLDAIQIKFACPDIIPLKGQVGVSASADTDGNKEIEAHIQASNESSSVSVEVKGSVSQDSSGNTKGSIETGVKVDF